jgi:hypothetical protein
MTAAATAAKMMLQPPILLVAATRGKTLRLQHPQLVSLNPECGEPIKILLWLTSSNGHHLILAENLTFYTAISPTGFLTNPVPKEGQAGGARMMTALTYTGAFVPAWPRTWTAFSSQALTLSFGSA